VYIVLKGDLHKLPLFIFLLLINNNTKNIIKKVDVKD